MWEDRKLLLAPRSRKRVYDLHTIKLATSLHIFRKKHAATALSGPADNEGIPELKPVKAIKVDSGKNARNAGSGDVKFGQ
jgi:hypothetical protein